MIIFTWSLGIANNDSIDCRSNDTKQDTGEDKSNQQTDPVVREDMVRCCETRKSRNFRSSDLHETPKTGIISKHYQQVLVGCRNGPSNKAGHKTYS